MRMGLLVGRWGVAMCEAAVVQWVGQSSMDLRLVRAQSEEYR